MSLLKPGDKVHIKFADTDLYFCNVPDYNGYAGVAGPASAKATFEVQVNPCYDNCISRPAGARTEIFEIGNRFIQFKQIASDDGRQYPMNGWHYYYHATTSTGKYDKNRFDNGKQFFLIHDGQQSNTTVEYGKRCKLLDVAYFGITCVRMDDEVNSSIQCVGPRPQYWLSAKYANIIEQYKSMYYDEVTFEHDEHTCIPSAPSISSVPLHNHDSMLTPSAPSASLAPQHDGRQALKCDVTENKLCPGHKVHIKFADTSLYICDIPDYNGYAATAGPPSAKATFEVELNPCFDKCITDPAGKRNHVFKLGDNFLQFKHCGDDKKRDFKMQGWRYYYHATTSTGKYDKKRSDNSKQFFLINGSETSVEYGISCTLTDMAYGGFTCVRLDDMLDTSIRLTGASPQYWLSAKYMDVIEHHSPMYYYKVIFENAAVQTCRGRPSVQGRKIVGNASLRLLCGLLKRSGAELDQDETEKLHLAYEQLQTEAAELRDDAICKESGVLTSSALALVGTSVTNIASRCCEAAIRAGTIQAEALIPGSISKVYQYIASSIWFSLLFLLPAGAWTMLSADGAVGRITAFLFMAMPVLAPMCVYHVAENNVEKDITNKIRRAANDAAEEERKKCSPVG